MSLIFSNQSTGLLLYSQADTLAVEREILDVDSDNSVFPGQISIVINATGLNVDPTTQSVTLGGEALTVTNWNSGNPIVTVPSNIDLLYGSNYELVITDDTGSVTFGTLVTLEIPSGWSLTTFNGSAPDPVETESIYEEAQTDSDLSNYTMQANDVVAYSSISVISGDAGATLSIDAQTIPVVSGFASITFSVKIWKNIEQAWTGTSTFTITDGGFNMSIDPILETETANPFSIEESVNLGVAQEGNTAENTGFHVIESIGVATELNASDSVGDGTVTAVDLPLAQEINNANPFTILESISLGLAQDLGISSAVGFNVFKSIGLVTESSTTDSIGFDIHAQIGVATETNSTEYLTVNTVVPTVLPTIDTSLGTTIYLTEGDALVLPAWTWDDDVSTGNAVSWDAVVVDTNTPGAYNKEATATNIVGSTTAILTIYVNSSSLKTPVFIPRKLETNVQTVSLFPGLGNWIEVQLSYDGTPIDLTQFIQFKLSGLTTEPLDSLTDTEVIQVTTDGKFYIDVGSIPVEDLKKLSGVVKTTLVGHTVEDTEGVMLWHPSLDNSRVSVNVHRVN